MPDPKGEVSYPIVTMSWILLYNNYADAKKAAWLKDLFAWCLADGQREAEDLGYAPLPPSVSDRSLESLQNVRVQ